MAKRTLINQGKWVFPLGGAFSIILIAIIFAGWGKTDSQLPVKANAGTFIPTQEQWDALKTQAVTLSNFRSETTAEGKIAVNGDQTTPVFSPYSGRISKVLAKPGDAVTKGAPLLEIEATEFSQGQNDLIAALSTVATSRSQAHIAEVKEHRQHALYDAKATAKQDWEQSQIDSEAAQNTLRSAEIALSLVKSKLHLLGATDDEMTALAKAKETNGKAIIASPIDGTVIDRQAAPGQFINSLASGATIPLFTIGNLSTLWLVANVRESDTGLVHVGDTVQLRLLAFPNAIFKAKLAYVAPSVDPSTHRLLVRAEVENPQKLLKPEMFASFTIMDGDERTAPGVPESAVVYEGEQAHVWVVTPERAIALRDIRIGRIEDGRVEVEGGLKAGESIISSGALFIDRAVKSE